MPAADDLYRRYMTAAKTWREHADRCTHCTDQPVCAAGARFYESLTRLQDAHLNRLRSRS